jgi:hypothetical protein
MWTAGAGLEDNADAAELRARQRHLPAAARAAECRGRVHFVRGSVVSVMVRWRWLAAAAVRRRHKDSEMSGQPRGGR